MAEKDQELDAIRIVIDALTPLDEYERSRVLEYVLKRLDMSAVRSVAASSSRAPVESGQQSATASSKIVDIRSLKEEKQPRSANEMAALAAYYVSELAPIGERSDTIDAAAIRRLFKMAGFRLPSVMRNVLPNTAGAGYLDNVSRGEYRLNPVGYNLVVHGLPRGSGEESAPVRRKLPRKKSASKKSARKKAPKKNRR